MSDIHPEPFASINDFLQTVDWPVMPEVGQALIRSLRDEDVDSFTICRIIGKDPSLVATLLRMANSAIFGLSGSVDTLERAVKVVGLNMIRTRALSVFMTRVAGFPFGLNRLEFWRYSLLCAGFAQWLAELCEVDDQEAWLAGMMLRLGELNLAQARPMALPKIAAKPIAPGERWVRQRKLIGFDEGQITAELAANWDFPPSLVKGLRQCGHPLVASEISKLAAVLNLAGRLADAGEVSTQTLEDLPLMLLTLLKLDVEKLANTAPAVHTLVDMSMLEAK